VARPISCHKVLDRGQGNVRNVEGTVRQGSPGHGLGPHGLSMRPVSD
jgi:hypothetical protein